MTTPLPDRFYAAFAQLDHATMNACYAPNAVFSDPAFGTLHGDEIAKMWTGLCRAATEFRVSHEVVRSSPTAATVTWTAHYAFPATGRDVVNHVTSNLTLADDRIVAHHDTFDFHAWAKQALGPPGLLLGWAPPFQRIVQGQARRAMRI